MPRRHPFFASAGEQCGHVPDLDLDEDVLCERRRCMLAIVPIMDAVERGAPPSVQVLMGLVIRQLLDLCPIHSTEEEYWEALAALGLSEGAMDTMKVNGLALAFGASHSKASA